MTGIYLKGDEDLSAFDSVEVHPVAEYSDFVEQVSEDEVGSDPEATYMWSVYLHYKTCGLYCVADFETEAGAEAYAAELRQRLMPKKRTLEEIKAYAEGAAHGHFYSDEETPWEPFEDWPQYRIEEEMGNLAAAFTNAMLWAQGGEK